MNCSIRHAGNMGSKYVVLVNTFPIDTGYIVFVVCNATNKYEDLGFLISHDTQVLLVTQFNTLLHYWKQNRRCFRSCHFVLAETGLCLS